LRNVERLSIYFFATIVSTKSCYLGVKSSALRRNLRVNFGTHGRWPKTLAGLGFCLLLSTSWASIALDRSSAIHLLNRTGFGVELNLLPEMMSRSKIEAVDYLLDHTSNTPRIPAPDLASHQKTSSEAQRLRSWWVSEMLNTPSPLTERMTLFWHGHFTSQLKKVKDPNLMLQQNLLFRRLGLGKFEDLLRAVAQDPAMLVYLGNTKSNKNNPNENFARELLELYTLGEGHYSEADVIAAAQAFTGWRVDSDKKFKFVARQHDNSDKTFMGAKGDLNGEEVIVEILAQPALATFIVGKFWREFVAPLPSKTTQESLAAGFRASEYDLKRLLRSVLLSENFWAEENRAALVKSPAELVVGVYRYLQVPVEDVYLVVRQLKQMGQNIFEPPDVSGWQGGIAWLDSTSVLAREHFLKGMARRVDSMNRVTQGEAYTFAVKAADYSQAYAKRSASKSLTADDLAIDLLPVPEHYVFNPAFQLK
jgi:uncharacterized protein (DUF1800 family)